MEIVGVIYCPEIINYLGIIISRKIFSLADKNISESTIHMKQDIKR